jgi:tripartite-type tricarboxylate transporter receptor subunit TctC
MRRIVLYAGLALLGALAQSSAAAQSAEPFYKGKTIRLLIGYGPGTGYDLYARLLAHHMSLHIPGNPVIVTENMPGAAGLSMMNYLYNVAPKDGTVLGTPSRSLFSEPLFGNSLAKYDASRFAWLGSMGRDTALCFTWHTSGINTLEDAKARKVLVGSPGPTAGSTIDPNLLNALFGTRFEPLIGYPDSGAIGIAMENGELQGYCGFTLAATKSARPDWLTEKKVNILVQLTLKPAAELKGVPVIADYAKDEMTRQALTVAFADQDVARPLAGPPGIPADRVKMLQKAFIETMKDPDLVSEAKQLSIDIDDPADGAAVAEVVRKIYATPPDVVAMVRKIRDGK